MRSTRRVTTNSSSGDFAVKTKALLANTATLSSGTRPQYVSTVSPNRQGPHITSIKTVRPRSTFKAILQSERQSNMNRLKNHGFVGNRIAELVAGRSQALCYRVKNDAISTLVRHGAASLLSLELSNRGPVVGIAGGGRLHVMPTSLSDDIRLVLQSQFTAALHSGKYFSGAAHENR